MNILGLQWPQDLINWGGKYPDYNEVTAGNQAIIAGLPGEGDARGASATAELSGILAQHEAGITSNVQKGLEARGLTSPGLAEYNKGAVSAGLSGAYASARAALSRAKLNASTGISSAVSNYQQELAMMQYSNELAKYKQKMGIWGTMIGAGAGLASMGKGAKDAQQNPNLNAYDASKDIGDINYKDPNDFRMKGVVDEQPLLKRGGRGVGD